MIIHRAKLAVLLVVLGFYTINRVGCTILLMTGSHLRGRIYIMNDLRADVKVWAPGIQNLPVSPGEDMTVGFTGTGDVIVTEDGNEIFRTDLEAGCFNIVRTHSTASITKVYGSIVLKQSTNDLSLVLNGCNGGHTLALNESLAENNQAIALNNDRIAITQPIQQTDQRLSFVGSLDSTALTHPGLIPTQNMSIYGYGGHHATLLSKVDGIYTLTSTVPSNIQDVNDDSVKLGIRKRAATMLRREERRLRSRVA